MRNSKVHPSFESLPQCLIGVPLGSNVLCIVYKKALSNPLILTTLKSLESSYNIIYEPFSSSAISSVDIAPILNRANSESISTVISIGGGTVIDLGKIMKSNISSCIHHIAVPTTAGTGSEATSFATFYTGQEKSSLDDHSLLPHSVIHDPRLVENVPIVTQIGCAFDTFSHSTESLFSQQKNKNSQKFALESLRQQRASNYLEIGQSLNHKLALRASYFGGCAINISKTTLAHALSYSITLNHQVHHGLAVFLMLPATLKVYHARGKYNSEVREAFTLICKMLNLRTAEHLIEYVYKLLERFNLSSSLMDYGVDDVSLKKYIDYALLNSRAKNAPIELNIELAEELFSLLRGNSN